MTLDITGSSTMLDAALSYAALDWRVFPLSPGGKQPLYANPHRTDGNTNCRGECGQDGHGCHDATSNASTIIRWWERTPSANIGLATGYPGPDVLDVDVKEGAPGNDSLASLWRSDLSRVLVRASVVHTPSGGRHLYFAGTTNQGNGRLPRHGLDFRGVGGYVVAPPSRIGDHRYEAAQWRLAVSTISWGAIREHFIPPRLDAASRPKLTGHRAVARMAELMGQQGSGNRNSYLHWAACRLISEGVSVDDLTDLHNAAIQAGLGVLEVDRTIRSAARTVGVIA